MGPQQEKSEETLEDILTHREPNYLRELLDLYKQKTGQSIEEAIREKTSGTTRDVLRTIVQSVKNRAEYFAKRLFNAMDGWGTDEDAIVRILVSRAEKDLGNIKMHYKKLFGRTLSEDIEDDTSGDDRAVMLAVVG